MTPALIFVKISEGRIQFQSDWSWMHINVVGISKCVVRWQYTCSLHCLLSFCTQHSWFFHVFR